MNKTLPEGWEEVKFIDLCAKARSGGTPTSTNEDYYNGDIPFVVIEDITDCGKYIWNTKKHITEKAVKSCSTWLVPQNSLLYSMYATLGEVSINKVPVATNQAILDIIPNHKKIDLEFLYYKLDWFKQFIHQFTSQTTQSNLNATTVKSFKFTIPSLVEEQQKIASILITIDNTIESTKALIEKHKNMKQGLMTDFIEPQKVPGDWKIKSISDIAIINPPKKRGISNDTPVSFLAMEDVSGEGRIIRMHQRNFKDVKEGFTSFVEGDVIFAKITPCMENGKGAYLSNLTNGIGFGSTEFHVLRAKNGNDPKFIYYLSTYKKLRIRAEANMTGTAGQQRVQSDFFTRYKLPIPSEGEQKTIAKQLDAIENKIISEESYLSKLIKIKAGLMQELLTGKKRVTVGA